MILDLSDSADLDRAIDALDKAYYNLTDVDENVLRDPSYMVSVIDRIQRAHHILLVWRQTATVGSNR